LVTAAVVAGCSDSATTPTSAAPSASVAALQQEITLLPPANATFPTAHGKAIFTTDGPELQIEVADMKRRIVVFFLDGQRLGARFVDSTGAARIDLRGAAAPASVAGKLVWVRTALGVPVVQGRFQ
jgi:hypothetical protein